MINPYWEQLKHDFDFENWKQAQHRKRCELVKNGTISFKPSGSATFIYVKDLLVATISKSWQQYQKRVVINAVFWTFDAIEEVS